MRIGIDIDDVVADTGKCAIEYAYKYEYLYCDNKGITSNLKDLMRGNYINDPMKKMVKAYAPEVWQNVKLKPNVIEMLNKLKSREHQLIFITTRGNSMGINAEKITCEYFEKHKIPYDKIIFGIYDKKQTCLDEKIDVFIDDSVDTCNDISNNTNIEVYLFDSEVNNDLQCDARRVYNWIELEKIINI